MKIYDFKSKNSMTSSKPLGSSDYARLIIFLLLLAPINVGAIVPAAILIYSLLSAKDNRDFLHIENAIRYCKIYFWLLAICIIVTQIYLVVNGERDLIYYIIIPISGLIIYNIALDKLVLTPLSGHREWVQEYGVFQRKRPTTIVQVDSPDGIGRSSSLADELVKLAQLKIDGHISDSEYELLKKKLLQTN